MLQKTSNAVPSRREDELNHYSLKLICMLCSLTITRVYKNHFEMVKGCRIDTGLCKRHYQKGFSKNTWNKGKLHNRYRARWAKGKTDIGLDEHRATHT